MAEQKLLSILIPTYNRADLICYTLSFFKEQIMRNRSECELIVCDNLSTDATVDNVDVYLKSNTFFSFVKYAEHVEVGDSITRSIENASGKFFIVFGDDDLPAPFMVDALIYELKKYPDIGMLVFNRMGGTSLQSSIGVEDLRVEGYFRIDDGEKYYTNYKEFVTKYNIQAGFISVDVLRRDLWEERYRDVYPNNHEGWNYMAPYFYSAKDYPAIYYQYPLCTRRTPARKGNTGHHQWEDRWGMYIFVGKARLLSCLNEYGMVDDWKKIYQDYIGNMPIMFHKLVNMTRAQALAPYIEELCAAQLHSKRVRMLRRLIMNDGFAYRFWVSYYKCGFSLWGKVRKIFKH